MKFRNNYIVYCLLISCLFSCRSNVETPEIGLEKIEEQQSKMVCIPAGTLRMGGNNHQADADEFPNRSIDIPSFYMDRNEVTNREFSEFVRATKYITVAERDIDWNEMKKSLPPGTQKPPKDILKAGSLVFKQTNKPVSLDQADVWWSWTLGASWKHPLGPESNTDMIMDHPVVHIAWEDAMAYANWVGKRLPTEAEWEWAARGGKENTIYPWGNENINQNPSLANFWQGIFPFKNTRKDGHELTAPVGSYPPNDYGLYDMAGNVWEWCADFYHANAYSITNHIKGPDKSYDPLEPRSLKRVMRGGSFLCNDDYCSGYRNARRMKSTMDSSFSHTGFRCAKSAN